MNTRTLLSIAASAVVINAAGADVHFQDNFESGLGQWTGKNSGAHHGVLVIDPFDQQNTVLSFNRLISAGDLFSSDTLTLDANESYILSFDYLGLATERTRQGDTGGYVGFSVDTPGHHSWQWATGTVSGAQDVLIDDGSWHSYEFEFTAADLGIGNSVHLMLEDFRGSRGVAGDAYFDNISFGTASVPAPGGLALVGLGVLSIARRRRA